MSWVQWWRRMLNILMRVVMRRRTPIEEIEDPGGEAWTGDDGEAEFRAFKKRKGTYMFALSIEEAQTALSDMTTLLHPRRPASRGYKPCQLNEFTKQRLEHTRSFLHLYIRYETKEPRKPGNWKRAASDAADAACQTPHYARRLKQWARDFVADAKELPHRSHGGGIRSKIDDEDISQEIKIHLQSIGKYMKAEDIVKFCETPEMLGKLGRTKTISLATARWWLIKMGYRWTKESKRTVRGWARTS